jgi:uncharacterized glyoxalase superfamily protein PhnB
VPELFEFSAIIEQVYRAGVLTSNGFAIWFNLNSKEEVNQLYEQWKDTQARMVSAPEAKPWKLHEFTATDLDGNLLRVFYDFSRDV